MAKKSPDHITRNRWIKLAQSKKVQRKIIADDGIDNYQAIIDVVARRTKLDWEEAIALMNMVYGWMPTMLKRIGMREPDQKKKLISLLKKVKRGRKLTHTELVDVQCFANGSIVGASKLLHVICPENYPIWDSRVARIFLWRGVSHGTFSQLNRYVDYVSTLREWATNPLVVAECANIKGLNPALSKSGNLRLIEFVMYHLGSK